MAFKIGTGFKINSIQNEVNAIELKILQNEALEKKDIQFLKDLYSTLASGAKCIPWLRQSGKLMAHYLSCSGEDLKIDNSIFVRNEKVHKEMEKIRYKIKYGKTPSAVYETDMFYMPDVSSLDSFYGLYWGKIYAYPLIQEEGLNIKWRFEVPWVWPSYEDLKEKYGSYDSEICALPNLLSIFIPFGDNVLYLNNGMGEYLTRIGLAKSFTAYCELEEKL